MCRLEKRFSTTVRYLWIRLCLGLAVLSFAGSVSAQLPGITAHETAQHWLTTRGEVILRFAKPAVIGLDYLTTFLSIDSFRQDTVTAYANEAGLQQFLSLHIPYEILQPPSLKSGVFKPFRKETGDWRSSYPSYTEYVNLMEGFVTDYPKLCRLAQFGTSINGHKLLALKITDNPGIRETEPVVLYSSSMHGDETLGYVLMLRLIDYLLANYDTDVQVKNLVDQLEIWINPLANPDGSFFMSDSSVAGATRFNASQTDLNRDFPDLRDEDWANRAREPETLAMMSFMKDLQVVLAANFHEGTEVVNFPWDTWGRPHADDAWYRYISHAYVDTVHVYGPIGYMTDLDNGISNGYAWYPVYGGRQDYTNYFLHAREVTIELSVDKMPPESSLENYWNYNRQSLLQYISRALSGFTGIVTDSVTGQPLEAIIRIEDHDKDHSYSLSSPGTGGYYRLTGGGNYILMVTAADYHEKKLPVQVTAGLLTQLDIRLKPMLATGLYPNPFSDRLNYYVTEPGDDLVLEFIDLSGRKVKRIIKRVMNAGIQDIAVSGLAGGVYIVNLVYGNKTMRQVLLKKGL